MPNAGEGANLAYNLAVLGRLGGLPLGTKLKFDAATNRFDVDDRFLITRTFSPDSVTSETHFATPMRDVVQQAARQAGTPAATQAAFDAAVRGLARLRMTYTSKPAKVTALDNILKTVAGLVQRVREAEDKGLILVALRERYPRHFVYAVRQRNYIDVGQQDVCHAFVLDWGRRLLAGRTSYAQTRGHGTFATQSTLGLDEHTRMQKKFGHVAALQTAERGRLESGQGLRRTFTGDPKYGGIQRVDVDVYGQFRDGDERLILPVVAAAKRRCRSEAPGVFMLELVSQDGRSAHMLGLQLSGRDHDDVQIFDPNVGEFRFMAGAGEFLWRFFDDLVNTLYTPDGRRLFTSWNLERIYRR